MYSISIGIIKKLLPPGFWRFGLYMLRNILFCCTLVLQNLFKFFRWELHRNLKLPIWKMVLLVLSSTFLCRDYTSLSSWLCHGACLVTIYVPLYKSWPRYYDGLRGSLPHMHHWSKLVLRSKKQSPTQTQTDFTCNPSRKYEYSVISGNDVLTSV